tara:strand:+ start:619 stop:891 length:273 start_codon:yes stop_codon:yes gene_type:complete
MIIDGALLNIFYTIGISICAFMLGRASTNYKKKLEESVEITIDILASKNYVRKKWEEGEWLLLDLDEVYKEGYEAGCNNYDTPLNKMNKV